MNRHILFIPVTGIPEVIHSETPVDIALLLREAGGVGNMACFTLRVDDEPMGQVCVLVGEAPFEAQENTEARKILVTLTGAHMLLYGPVAFVDTPVEKVLQILREMQ